MLARDNRTVYLVRFLHRKDFDGAIYGPSSKAVIRITAQAIFERDHKIVETDRRATLVVVKLDIVRKHRPKSVSVALVIRNPESRIFRQDSFSKFLLISLSNCQTRKHKKG